MSKTFSAGAHDALRNTQLRRNLHVATTTIRGKRAAVTAERPDWEELRSAGEALKRRVLRHLDHYLLDSSRRSRRRAESCTGLATHRMPTRSWWDSSGEPVPARW